MDKKTEALKLAEDALKRVRTQDMELVQLSMIALAAIREALAEQPAQDNTYGYAKYLAEAMFKRHFASDEHYASGRVVWGVNDTVIGILTQIDNMVADMVRRPAQVDGDTIVQTFTGLPRRKLRDLLSGGWEVNGVCFQRTETDGTVRRGAATTGGMVLWWNAEQPAQQEPVGKKTRIGLVTSAGWDSLPVGTEFYTSPQAQPAQQEPVAWMYSEGLEALKNGKPWTAYGTKQEANNIALYLHPTPECEPYAWVTFTPYGDEDDVWYENPEGQLLEGWTYKPLYDTAPPRREWVDLTDEDIKEAEWLLSAIKEHEAYTLQEQLLVEGVDVFARAIEAKLKEKNDGHC